VPLCARCSGLLVGCLALPPYASSLRWPVSITLIAAFLVDSVTQLYDLRTSNNALRFVTGAGFSLGVSALLVGAAKWLWTITL